MTSSFIRVRDIDIPRVDIVIVLLLQLAGLSQLRTSGNCQHKGYLLSIYLSKTITTSIQTQNKVP